MRKLYIVKKEKDFEKIIKEGKCNKNRYFVIHHLKNNLPYDRYGVSVSKKLGNAVFRNKYKRIIRNILMENKKTFQNNRDYIIMIKKTGLDKSYLELKEDLQNI